MNIFEKIFGNKKGKSDTENYFVYCILGKVEHEREKLQYKEQWMKCYAILNDFLSDCETKSVSSEQVYRKVFAYGDDGYPKVSFKGAPTGGLLKWNEKNNRKICETHLDVLLQEIEEAEKKKESYEDWLKGLFPERNTNIEFWENQVLARIEKTEDLNRNQRDDFILRLYQSAEISLNWPANQAIDILISKKYANIKGEELIAKLIRRIVELSKAVKIGKTEMPAAIYTKEENTYGGKRVHSLIGRKYGIAKELKFAPNLAGNNWDIII